MVLKHPLALAEELFQLLWGKCPTFNFRSEGPDTPGFCKYLYTYLHIPKMQTDTKTHNKNKIHIQLLIIVRTEKNTYRLKEQGV